MPRKNILAGHTITILLPYTLLTNKMTYFKLHSGYTEAFLSLYAPRLYDTRLMPNVDGVKVV